MNHSESPFGWSFPAGTWLMTRVRISVLVPIVLLLFIVWIDDVKIALVVGGVLFFSILFHEFAHVFAARMTGGYGDEILLWPLGGLAFVNTGPTTRSRILTPLAGPLSNLAICGIVFVPVVQSGQALHAINPRALGELTLYPLGFEAVCVLTFVVNWFLMLVNLVPVYPLDGGQVLKVILSLRMGNHAATRISLRVGIIIGLVALIIGMFLDSTTVVAIGAMLVILNMYESFRFQVQDSYDDSFMGYDFSQGYTSLEQSADDEREQSQGMLERWREKRRQEREERERQVAEQEKEQVDAILQKLHESGYDSLSDSERRVLKNASERLRNRDDSEQ